MKKNTVNPITSYGLSIKTELLKLGKTQNWLIDEIKKRTSLFVDTSVLNKLMTGRRHSKELNNAIREILGVDFDC